LAEVLHSKIQRFWTKRLGPDKHIYLHRSVEGQTINLKESENATRILSIHTSKGNGCEVVFLLGCTEQALRVFSKQTGNLVYDSLLHVAITRQKKSLYIGVDNDYDDIYRRIKK
jgi:superfamily I DNA/RNA helicase